MQLLELKAIDKSFPGVKALDNISLQLKKGEILAIVGENGAGKSTLIKILGGVHQPDKGSIFYQCKPISIPSPSVSKKLGIAVIHQELNIIPSLSVQDNLFLGNESGLGWINNGKEKDSALQIFDDLGVQIKLDQPCWQLNTAHQQLVEIAKALLSEIQVLIMDEPTASQTKRDVEHLFKVIKKLTSAGISVIYISHKLEEVEALADRIFILRDGKHITTQPKAKISRNELIEFMVGRKLENEFPKHTSNPGEVILKVQNLTHKETIKKVSFELRKGELVGIAGLVGAGRSELLRLIVGAQKPTGGTINLQGEVVVINSPLDSVKQGIGMVPEDRKEQSLVLNQSVYANFSLVNLPAYSSFGWVNDKQLASRLSAYKEKMGIKFAQGNQKIKFLSGGNQQKVIIAKWLEKDCDLFIFDEPTRGIDVGAKYEIYELLMMLIESGKSILMVSSELPELLGVSDRILVMKNGQIVGSFNDLSEVGQEEIMELCF